MIFALLLTCLFLALLHHYTFHFSRKGRLLNRIPADMPFPIIGNILNFYWYSSEESWLYMHNFMNKHYPISNLWIFTIPNIFICHPVHMEKILNNTKHIAKGYSYDPARSWLGDGLLTSKGEKWFKRRKILTPAFHFSILKQFVEILIKEGDSITESFDHTKETIIENIKESQTSMGTSLKDMNSFQQQYRQAVHDIGQIITERLIKPWLLNDTIFSLSSLTTKQNKYLNTMHSFTEKIIAKRKRYHEQTGDRYLKNLENSTGNEEIEVTVKKKRLAMFDILIAESRNSELTDLDIREEIDTFVFAGHDTVAISTCFTLLLLAEHKDIQDRVRKEICEVMQENDGKLTMSALQNLSYLERCLKESLRMYPSAPIISRVCSEDIDLQPYVLPKDTTIYLAIYELHHDCNFWSNPEIFNPDRFLPENIQKRHAYSYIPFSAGPRNCIGRFATLELKALIAPMVYNFYLEPVDRLKDVKLKADFVLRATRPIRMKIIPIKRT